MEYVNKNEFNQFKSETDKRLKDIEKPINEIQIMSAKILEKVNNLEKNNDLKNEIVEERINSKLQPIDTRLKAVENTQAEEEGRRWQIILGISTALIGVIINVVLIVLKIK